MKVRTLTLFAILFFICNILKAQKYDFQSASYGNKLFYKVIDNTSKIKTVSVVSELSREPYYTDAPTGSLVIPSEVNHEGNTYSVVSIGEEAFSGCDKITSVSVPGSVTEIGNTAFAVCNALRDCQFSEGLKKIGSDTFYKCESLKSITIPASLTDLRAQTFLMCINLSEINVHPGNQIFSSVDGVLFDVNKRVLISYPMAKDGSYMIPGTVTTIASEAFYRCKLDGITIPSSVTKINEAAFFDCRLNKVTVFWNTPLVINNVFFITPATKLIVPVGTKDKYQQAEGWGEFLIIDETTTSLSGVYDQGTMIHSCSGGIRITLAEAKNICIFNITGISVCNQSLTAGVHSISVPRGVYIVHVGSRSQKVIVK